MASQSFGRYETTQRRQFTTSSSSSNRSGLGYWLPLALTVGVATAGAVAWIVKSRSDDDDDEDYDDYYEDDRRTETHGHDDHQTSNTETITLENRMSRTEYDTNYNAATTTSSQRGPGQAPGEGSSIYSRVTGAIARTPSPQQIFDSASKRVVGGFSAAGVAAGSMLSSIREEDRDDDLSYQDHSRWHEEFAKSAGKDPATVAGAAVGTASVVKELGKEVQGQVVTGVTAPLTPNEGPMSYVQPMPVVKRDPNKKRKIVAVVLSAETSADSSTLSLHEDHPSLLDHLPNEIDHNEINLHILLYDPNLKILPNPAAPPPSTSASQTLPSDPRDRDSSRPSQPPSTSYSPSSAPGFATPTSDSLANSTIFQSTNPYFSSLHRQALSLVESPHKVLPFNTHGGWVYMLRHVQPNLLYLQESFAGENGGQVSQIVSWVGQTIVVIGGDADDGGGLADDTADEGEGPEKKEKKWWEESGVVGLGKGVDVVDVVRLGDDWWRRVEKK